ncbi:multiple sugar transport system ATP-binding protein [Palleronia aestuarii]|uniref:Multiple sugar transport system ATP-binding protein n=1 Tax=Palleronia aestuarii TaxID=568105 RepID=A0A2W7N5P5_9RHOB|nr:ABC transporter ATP-binding protein [Palleronia aestuarii]PZX13597.1 multiple sugar transport system ATP-binding protein [Palleronia aestuarii]
MAEIQITNMSKIYGNGMTAVDDLTLHIRDGEFLVLVGPSGCGKSTILRMIAGLKSISSGELRIGDRVVNDLEPKERDIAMVFQSYALYPHMTVAENIGFPLRLEKRSPSEIETRVKAAAETLELSAYLDRKPSQLSGGQRQRVAMGRAIVRQPSVYLLDEPLSNLDAKLRDATRAEMVDLQARLGVTTVYVTHDQVEAMTMGDRVAVMKDGTLQQCAAPRELYSRPANQFVAGFIGTPAMNFIPAEIRGDAILAGDHAFPLPAELSPAIGTLPDGHVTLGIRPEHLSIGPDGIPAEVVAVEELGFEAIVRVSFAGAGAHDQLIVRAGGETEITRGETVRIGFGEKIHVFDANGQRLGEMN